LNNFGIVGSDPHLKRAQVESNDVGSACRRTTKQPPSRIIRPAELEGSENPIGCPTTTDLNLAKITTNHAGMIGEK
jgi:hypothetical protein